MKRYEVIADRYFAGKAAPPPTATDAALDTPLGYTTDTGEQVSVDRLRGESELAALRRAVVNLAIAYRAATAHVSFLELKESARAARDAFEAKMPTTREAVQVMMPAPVHVARETIVERDPHSNLITKTRTRDLIQE